MTSRPITVKRPYTVVALATLGLIMLLAVGGTAIYLAELPLTSPVPLVFTPIALGLILWATLTHRWQRLGFTRRPRGAVSDSAWLPVALPIVLALALVVATTGGAIDQSPVAWLGLAAFVALVAFVEETIFRSVFLAVLSPKGLGAAVLVSAAAFALAHAVNLLGGQDLAGTLGQIGFAVAFGLFAACAYLRTGSIWPAILFHAGFDAAQLGGAHQTPPAVDAVLTVLLLAGAAWLWSGIRRRGPATRGATPAATRAVATAR